MDLCRFVRFFNVTDSASPTRSYAYSPLYHALKQIADGGPGFGSPRVISHGARTALLKARLVALDVTSRSGLKVTEVGSEILAAVDVNVALVCSKEG